MFAQTPRPEPANCYELIRRERFERDIAIASFELNEFLPPTRMARGCVTKSLSFGILADCHKNVSNGLFDRSGVNDVLTLDCRRQALHMPLLASHNNTCSRL